MLITLRSKLFAGYLFVVLLLALLGVYSVVSFRDLNDLADAALEQYSANSLSNLKMYESLVRMNEAQLDMLGGDYERGSTTLYTEPDKFYALLQESERIVAKISGSVHGKIPELLTKVEIAWQHYRAQVPEFAKVTTVDKPNGKKFYDGVLMPSFTELKVLNFSLTQENITAFRSAQVLSKKNSDQATTTVIVVTLFAMGMGIIGSFLIAGRTTAPLRILRETLKKIQAGNLGVRIPISSADEVGDVSYEFNRMTERLERYEAMNINLIIAEKQKSESIIASIDDPLMLLDDEGRLLMMNRAAESILGIDEAIALGKKLSGLFREDKVLRTIEAALQEKVLAQTPLILQFTIAGIIRFYRLRVVSITSENTKSEDRMIGKLLIFTDITHFEELDRMKSDFIAKVSHEFRTPLTSIRMSLDILDNEIIGKINAEQKDIIVTSKEDTERLGKLIKDLLTLSRREVVRDGKDMESGSDCNSSFDSITKSMRQLFAAQNIEFVVNCDEIPLVRISSYHLESLLQNLLSNALKFTSSGGCVKAEMKYGADGLVLWVSDTGIGLRDEDKERIFDKFIQVKPTDASSPGSIGLGLAIVNEIVKSYHGTISVDSEIGKGSTFLITLPLQRS